MDLLGYPRLAFWTRVDAEISGKRTVKVDALPKPSLSTPMLPPVRRRGVAARVVQCGDRPDRAQASASPRIQKSNTRGSIDGGMPHDRLVTFDSNPARPIGEGSRRSAGSAIQVRVDLLAPLLAFDLG